MKEKISNKLKQDSIFSVNYEGYASIYIDLGNMYTSKNQVKTFSFRSYENAEDMDGTDFWGLSEEELNSIFEAFDFQKISF